ncbi:hypothetical protein Plhal710r2_c006g0027221 [Plasmopara halstedii]
MDDYCGILTIETNNVDTLIHVEASFKVSHRGYSAVALIYLTTQLSFIRNSSVLRDCGYVFTSVKGVNLCCRLQS